MALRSVVTNDRLDLEILLEAEDAAFPAVSGLLVAAERSFDVLRFAVRRIVQINAPCPQSRADAARFGDIAGPDITRPSTSLRQADAPGEAAPWFRPQKCAAAQWAPFPFCLTTVMPRCLDAINSGAGGPELAHLQIGGLSL